MFTKFRSHLNLNNGVLLVALLVTVSWVWGTVGAIQQNFLLQQQVDSLAQQNGFAELENQTLHFENQYFASAEYLELSARDHLSKAGAGEKLLVLPSNTVTDNSASNTSATTPITKRSNFAQWLYFLFGTKG